MAASHRSAGTGAAGASPWPLSRLFAVVVLLMIGYQGKAVIDLYSRAAPAPSSSAEKSASLRGSATMFTESSGAFSNAGAADRFLRPLPPGVVTTEDIRGPAAAAAAVPVGAAAGPAIAHVHPVANSGPAHAVPAVAAPAAPAAAPAAGAVAGASPHAPGPGDDDALLTMCTTLMSAPEGSQKYHIQMNTLKALKLLPGINIVVFSTDAKLVGQVAPLGIEVVTEFKQNPDGMPWFKGMLQHVEQHHPDSFFHGYCNGDILFSPELVENLKTVKAGIEGGSIHQRVLMIGQRYNVDMDTMTVANGRVITDAASADALFHTLLQSAKAFQPDAEDYFITRRGTFPWESIPALVVGRVAYDNWIVDWAVHHEVDTIDLSQTLHAIHQTGSDGNMAGHSTVKPNRLWNHPLGNGHYDHGKTTSCRLMSRPMQGRIALKERYPFGRYKASAAEDRKWNKPNCNVHPTWRTCHGATE